MGLDDGARLARRFADGPDHVDDSFLWWINTRRGSRKPDREKLDSRVRELFDAHWPTRVSRGLPRRLDDVTLSLHPHDNGLIASTLPFPLHAGSWRLRVEAAKGSLTSLERFEIRIVAPGGIVAHILPLAAAHMTATGAEWSFEQSEVVFALAIDLHVGSLLDPVELALPLDLREVGA
jgi:hypothetical protein